MQFLKMFRLIHAPGHALKSKNSIFDNCRRMSCEVSMGRYSPGEHSEVHFIQPTLCGWPRPKLLKIEFLQMCRMMSYEVSIGSYSSGEL